MLDGLERTNRTTELHAILGVLNCHVETHLRSTNLLGGKANSGKVKNGGKNIPASAIGTDERSFDVGEFELGLLAGLIHGGQRRAGETSSIASNREEAHASGGASSNDDHVRGVTVDDVGLRAVDLPGSAIVLGGCFDTRFVPATIRFGKRNSGDGFTGCDARKDRGLGRVVTGLHHGVRSKNNRGEVRRAQKGAAHLFKNNDEFDVAITLSTELFGNGETLQTELLGHLCPHDGVVTALGVHLLTNISL
ncbi:unannotated protein [freshwater metagenome]|uniref:Unannotated protein n=1 Tax=freshwater metagenome TaxID=449393 RepID=A0A6J7LEL8_9ZZZZ